VLRRSYRIFGLILVVVAIAATIYVTRWRDSATPGGAAPGGGARGRSGAPIPVRAVAVRNGSIDVTLDALGTVTARNTVVVRARVDGQLSRVAFQEGREVKAGAVLAEIDPRPFQAALDQAQGQLARDEALLASSRSDLSRYQTLLAQDSIAKQQVDDQAALVGQYAGTVQADRGALATARLQLSWTRVTAPISGRVGLRQVDEGNVVHAADTTGIVVLTQTQPINVVFAVPAERAPQIQRRWKDGAVLQVDAFDRDGRTRLARGRLESADNVVDPTTSTVKMKAVFDNADGALFPNQFVNARLTLATQDGQALVPGSAVQRGTPGTFVYVVNADSTVSVRPVTLGTTNGDTVAIAQGLKADEKVVVDGTDKLRDHARVEAAVDAPVNPQHGHGGHGGHGSRGGVGGQGPWQGRGDAGHAPAAGAPPDGDPSARRHHRAESGGAGQ